MSHGANASVFLARLPEHARERLDGPALDDELAALITAARAQHPGLQQPDEAFVAYVAARVPDTLASLRAGDLWLACGCARGDGAFVAAFRAAFGESMRASIRRVLGGARSAAIDDVEQGLLEVFFVGTEARPGKIAQYAGRGDLRSWAAVVAAREALRLVRREKNDRMASDEPLLALAASGDAELDPFRGQYRAELGAAFEEAMKALEPRERTLLRQHYLDGLGIDALGALHRVHRATVARWIQKTREKLVDDLRARLTARLALAPQEYDSLVRMVEGQLDRSIGRFLQTSA